MIIITNNVQPIRLVVELDGGLVRRIVSENDIPIEVIVADYDVEGHSTDELTTISGHDVYIHSDPPVIDQVTVKEAFQRHAAQENN